MSSSSPPSSATDPKKHKEKHSTDISPEDAKFTPEEEKELQTLATSHKTRGNTLFSQSPPDYQGAITAYNEALSCCPKYLHTDRSIFHANIASCYIKLEKWKEAEDAATESLIESGDEEPSGGAKNKKQRPKKVEKGQTLEDENSDDEDDDKFEDAREEQVEEIPREEMKQAGNWKARLRRAKAREMQDKWGSLAGALEDYTLLYKYPPKPPQQTPIPPADMKTIRQAMIRLPPVIEQRKKVEVDEMMGKLKELGNGILRPFGLSTDNFSMTQNEGGGYSFGFNQNAGKK